MLFEQPFMFGRRHMQFLELLLLLIAADTSIICGFGAQCCGHAVPPGSSYSYYSVVPFHTALLLEVFKRDQTP